VEQTVELPGGGPTQSVKNGRGEEQEESLRAWRMCFRGCCVVAQWAGGFAGKGRHG